MGCYYVVLTTKKEERPPLGVISYQPEDEKSEDIIAVAEYNQKSKRKTLCKWP